MACLLLSVTPCICMYVCVCMCEMVGRGEGVDTILIVRAPRKETVRANDRSNEASRRTCKLITLLNHVVIVSS